MFSGPPLPRCLKRLSLCFESLGQINLNFEPDKSVTPPLLIPSAVVLIALVVATVTDLRKFKIHNLLTLPLLVLGFVYHGIVSGTDGLLFSLWGTLFGGGILLVLFLLGGIGGGDVKLLAGVGAWLGIMVTFWLFNIAAIAAGVYALVLIVKQKRLKQTWLNLCLMGRRLVLIGRHVGAEEPVDEVAQRSDRRKQLIPFGAMLGIGMLVLLLVTQLRTAH